MIFHGILWRVRTGVPWRDVPQRYGSWQTVSDRFHRWRKDGTWQRIVDALQMRLDEQGEVEWDLWCVDGSNIRAAQRRQDPEGTAVFAKESHRRRYGIECCIGRGKGQRAAATRYDKLAVNSLACCRWP